MSGTFPFWPPWLPIWRSYRSPELFVSLDSMLPVSDPILRLNLGWPFTCCTEFPLQREFDFQFFQGFSCGPFLTLFWILVGCMFACFASPAHALMSESQSGSQSDVLSKPCRPGPQRAAVGSVFYQLGWSFDWSAASPARVFVTCRQQQQH